MRSFLLLLLLLPSQVRADVPAGPAPIGLREAVARALRQNPTLAQAGADVSIAEGLVESARGLDDLILDAGATWLQVRHQLVSGVPVQQPAFDDLLASVALTQPLPTGGRLGLRLGSEYSRTEYSTDLGMGLQSSLAEAVAPSLQLTLQHPLLRGLGPKVARAPRRRALVQRDAAALSRDMTAAALLRDLVSAYWDLYYAVRELEIRRAAADSAREQLRRVQAQIEVGKQPSSASAEVEVAIALRDDAVLSAEQAAVERSVELERLMGQPAQAPGWLTAADTPALDGEVSDPAAELGDALDHSPQLALARAQGRAARIEVDVTENGVLPQLDLSFSGGTVGNASDPRTAFGQLAQPGSYSVTAGLVFQLPLQNRAARGARDAARHGLHKARLNEADVRNQIAAAVARLCAAARTAGQRAAVLSRSNDAAAIDLAAERARFEVGRSTNFDVLRRQEEVAQVQLAKARAVVDQVKAVAALEALSGKILDRFGVRTR